MRNAKKIVQSLFSHAGIKIDGYRPWDIKVNDEKFYSRIISEGSLGLGESYMDGWWECKALDQFFDKLLNTKIEEKVKLSFHMIIEYTKAKLSNRQTKKRSLEVGEKHYDVGNDLYKVMLDKRMIYTCGYWKSAKTLDKAQEDKLDLVCKKIGLKKGQKVLDIGCGWGSFAKFAAEKYGAKVVGITISKEQVRLAKEKCKELPVEIRFQDYRDVDEKFNHIISLGMFEHVGHKNYREYMGVASRCLKDEGVFLLHTIGSNKSTKSTDPWYHKYIFPNSKLPSAKQITAAAEGLFIMEDWHNFGIDYDKTLMQWHKNFNKGWSKIKQNYDKRFFRMWNYYLLMSTGSFRARRNQLWQVVFSKSGVKGGYKSIR
jgi:cyclopropane-fatty-acyl-phospholipid synthase